MAEISASVEGDELVLRLPLQSPPVLSESGKTFLVAGTFGTHMSHVYIEGHRVMVTATAYYKNRDHKKGG